MTQFSGPDRVYAFADSLAATAEEHPLVEEAPTPWVAFVLAGEWYALPVGAVQEIIRVAEITRVPDAPAVVRGVVNLRGRVLPVVDLRLRLGLPPIDLDVTRRILVLPARGRWIGVLVDSVSSIERIRPSEIQPVPPDLLTLRSDYFSGVTQKDAQLFVLLDAERVLMIHDTQPAETHQFEKE
jgi:purine-binding chemotaxis protein CheW